MSLVRRLHRAPGTLPEAFGEQHASELVCTCSHLGPNLAKNRDSLPWSAVSFPGAGTPGSSSGPSSQRPGGSPTTLAKLPCH